MAYVQAPDKYWDRTTMLIRIDKKNTYKYTKKLFVLDDTIN